jgi:uncharacterized protein (DUF58 family)
VRAYQRGDPFRRVHWPATARTGQVMVKQYQPAIARETLICLDLCEDDYAARYRYDAIELAIVVAASLANHMTVREGLPVGLATQAPASTPGRLAGGRDDIALPPRKERAHLTHILEVLAEVEMITGDTRPFTALLRRERMALSWGGTVAVVTGRGSAALSDALLQLRRGGLAVALILVGIARPTDGAADWSPPPGVSVHCVSTIRDLEALG